MTQAPLERRELPWRDLARRLRPFVAARVGSAADADDVLQEVLLRIHRHAAAVEDPARFSGWMHQVARRAVADHHRRRRLPVAHPEASASLAADDASEGDGAQEPAGSIARALSGWVARLPPGDRDALTLTALEGMPQAAAAERLGVSLPALKSRVLRGRARLRAMLEACCRLALDARRRVTACEPRQSSPDCTCAAQAG